MWGLCGCPYVGGGYVGVPMWVSDARVSQYTMWVSDARVSQYT